MPVSPTLLTKEVEPGWVDYNGHMGDFAYAAVFTQASDKLLGLAGVDADYLKISGCTIYTLETHITYLKELFEGQKLSISGQVLDLDRKRVHAILEMKDAEGDPAAYYEVMSMHMCRNPDGKPAPADFPEPIYEALGRLADEHSKHAPPKYVGSKIGIRRRQAAQ